MLRDWLKAVRENKTLTQHELSKMIGISQSHYCEIETGKAYPSVDTAKKIATVLGFDWTKFYEDEIVEKQHKEDGNNQHNVQTVSNMMIQREV